MNVLLMEVGILSVKKIALRTRKGNFAHWHGCPLIFQNILLSELAPWSAFADRLSRHHRAGPSASLDKSADQGYSIVRDNTTGQFLSQLRRE
jgi:hypothetical protein